MVSKREMRRIVGLIVRYFPDSLLHRVADPRDSRGQRWKYAPALLRAALCGHVAGCKGTGELEDFTAEMSRAVRKQLGLPRRLPDTTMRDFLCALDPTELTHLLAVVGYDAWRRKAFHHALDVPWGVASFDGKYPTLRDKGTGKKGVNEFLQVHHDEDGQPLYGTVRTITAVLISAAGRPILGATPVPGDTNEVGHFQKAFGDMVRMYGKLFRVAMYDAGGASQDNFKAVLAAGKHAVFQIANPNWVMYKTIELLLRDKPADVVEEEVVSARERVVRHLTMLRVTSTGKKDETIWPEVKTVIKVYSETYEDGELTGTKTRLYVTSLEHTELTAAQWLKLIVARWGVESVHQILDVSFAEDKRPWITSDAQGALAVMLLRRVAYTVLALYKWVTQRSEEKRLTSWRKLMERIKKVHEWASDEAVAGLRLRTFAVPPALA